MSTLRVKFGKVTSSEMEVMLVASSEGGDQTAGSILRKYYKSGGFSSAFVITISEAEYLRDAFINDSDRVAQGVSDVAGRAFENAGMKLDEMIRMVSQ